MQKDFEAKKQEIADYIEHNFRLDGNPKMDNTHKYVIKSVNAQKLVSMINELQPPKPPTCATCKHFSNYIDHKECECEKSANYCQEISDPQKYVCIKHSDYEVAE